MKAIVVTIMITIALLFSACSTPYQRSTTINNGYIDYPVGNKTYYLSFEGNRWTSAEDVSRYWYRRASEICGGPESYTVLDSGNSSGSAGPLLETYFRKEGRIKCN